MARSLNQLNGKPRVVVLGGGFGGLNFCQKFRGDAEVVLVDRQNHHLFQPLLYQVATAALSVPDVCEPLRSIFNHRKNIQTVMDEVVGIDLDQKTVRLKSLSVPYTHLVIGLGGKVSYFGNDHWGEHAPGLKSVGDAMRIRRRILTSFEEAETSGDEEERRRLMTIVVVGGGPTGVEMAGAMAELTKQIFRQDFRRIDPTEAKVILVDTNDLPLKMYSEKLSYSAKRQLESLGVECRMGVRVSDIDAEGVDLNDGTRIDTRNMVWGGGLIAAPVLKTMAGVELTKTNQIKVEPDLSAPGRPEVFAIGDCVSLVDAKGQQVPGLAPAAMQMGKHAARVISDELKHGPTEPAQRRAFSYWDKGSMATIGRKKAVADIGPLEFSGVLAWLAWLFVHLMFLIGFRNRISVMIEWFYAYISFKAGARIIYNPSGADPDPDTPDASTAQLPPEDAANTTPSADDESKSAEENQEEPVGAASHSADGAS